MELKGSDIKKITFSLAGLILFYWALQNLSLLGGWLGKIIHLFNPFILSFAIAFVINVPMVQIEKLLFGKMRKPNKKLARSISLVLTILLLLAVVFVVLFLVVPELGRSFGLLGESITPFLENVKVWAEKMTADYPEISQYIATLHFDWGTIINKSVAVLQASISGFLNSTLSVASLLFSGLLNFFLAIVFAVYILLQKETMAQRSKLVLDTVMSKKNSTRIINVLSLTNHTFANFLSGQCVEAVILGVLFFITMSILRFPYALMISVLIGFTAIIPIFGAFIGCAVGAFLILMINPMQALWFLIVFLVIQQVEGNLIYPKVVGGSIGLPSIWVLLAVTVGGSSFGIMGMLIFIPLCSVLYTLLWQWIQNKKVRK